jgi:hypothetical protein
MDDKLADSLSRIPQPKPDTDCTDFTDDTDQDNLAARTFHFTAALCRPALRFRVESSVPSLAPCETQVIAQQPQQFAIWGIKYMGEAMKYPGKMHSFCFLDVEL